MTKSKNDASEKIEKNKKTEKTERDGKHSKSDRMKKSDYEEQLEPLELALNELARWLKFTGKRLMVVV